MGAKQIRELCFVDVETTALTGPDAGLDAIIEIAAARVDLETRRIVDSFDTLIRPHGQQAADYGDGSLEWGLGEYHITAGHFDGVDWHNGIDHTLALEILRDRFLMPGATVAGQNPGFDIRHLNRDFDALGMPRNKLDYHVPDLCSPALFLVMAGKTEGVSLRNVIPWAYADPERKQAHRAGGDVQDAIRVFFAMFDFFTRGITPHPGEGFWS